jgi:amino acid adenylation domain-containing protein
LRGSGYDPAKARELPGYVAARGLVERPEWFDRGFFNIGPKEAEVMDPQHRVFLEVAWEALEDAGCDPSRYPGLIGVFAGMSNNTYYPYFVRARRDLMEAVGTVNAVIANEKDFLTTRLAYKLNLRGPALNIQTACSSSLVTVCVGVQTLLAHGCDIALAGGVSLTFPQERGYFYNEGGMTSADGYCRPFDARASGTVFSSGAGVVALKRLEDALADGDPIYAVIKGQATNNDGLQKVSFAAPSVDGQSEVIALAQAIACISPETISYIEAHGTATLLGDPIEIAGLAQVFRAATDARQYCALGSLKGNIGHCDAASGITSLIKTALAFRHELIPPSINCEQINPALEIEQSPFFINRELREWKRGAEPRRAGVSSFGVGGTNAHIVLEEAPVIAKPGREEAPVTILVLSAKTSTALEKRATDLADFLEGPAAPALADIAWTLQTGRQVFQHRRAVVAHAKDDAISALRAPARLARNDDRLDTGVAFLFPGQGAQYPGMGAGLYGSEAAFRDALDECAEILRGEIGGDLREIMFAHGPEAAARLTETRYTQPAIFAMDYALGRLWLSKGIKPAALLGHSVGEWAAAALAGIFPLADAARLVAMRARLVQGLPGGAMLAARLPEADAREHIAGDPRLEIAAVNGPTLCVISGPFEAIEALEFKFSEARVAARKLSTSHAFHSAMVEPVVEDLRHAVATVRMRAPQLPIISSVTGKPLTDAEATDPQYWAAHLRVTVRFADGLATLCSQHSGVLLECGPGRTLGQLAFQCPGKTAQHEIAHSITEGEGEPGSTAEAAARMWLRGVPLDWTAVHHGVKRRKLSGLPAYPFDRQRYFADLPAGAPIPLATAATDGEAPWDSAGEVATARPAIAQDSLAQEATAAAEGPRPDDPAGMLGQLRIQLSDLSGIDLAEVPASTSLLELGFDSLFLSQVALALARRFGVKITLGQLIRGLDTLEALAAHLAEHAKTSPAAAKPASIKTVATTGKPSAHGPFQPVRPDMGAGLTAPQQRWLDDFITRYAARTARSKAHTQANRKHFADPRAVSGFAHAWKEIVYPIVVDRSSGFNLWDIDGNEWNDITLSFGAAMLGHQPQFVVDAIHAQTQRGFEIGPTSPLAGEVAALLCELTGGERATFCNTGSEAVAGALRVARTVTARPRIAYFVESYHGIDGEVLGRAQSPGQFAAVPIAPGIPPEVLANALILPYGDPAALDIIAQNGNDLAAVLVEPVQSRRPALQPGEFLRELRAVTSKHGIALIFDEIITGFRCHLGGAQAHFGVQADMATYGKVIGGGLPIGAIVGRAEYMDAFDGGQWAFGDDSFPQAAMTFFAGTFVRHPLALAVARAVLSHMKSEGPALQETLAGRAETMIAGINTALAGTPFHAERFGSNWLLRAAPDFRFTALMFAALRHRGMHIWQGRPCFLSVAHTDAAIGQVIDAFRESAAELEAAEFFKRTANDAAPATPSNVIPLTPAQREVWILCQQNALANTACNETWTLSLDGPLDADALREAAQIIVDRHDALRCTFDRNGETLTIAPRLTLDIPLVDLSTFSTAEREKKISEIRATEGGRVFNLETGPLATIQLVRLAPEQHALIFNAHHLACDGWSCDVFLHELSALYSAHRDGTRAELQPPMSIREYQRWDADLRETAEYKAELDFWLTKYATPPAVLDLPGDRPLPAQRTYRGASEEMILGRNLPAALTQMGARHGATYFTVLLAAYQALLFRLTGEPDLTVGIPSAGQNNIPGGDRLMGHCINMLPLRHRLDPAGTFAQLLRDLQGDVLDAFDNRRVTFGEVLHRLAPPRLPGRVPLIPVTFNLDPPLSGLHFSGLKHRLDANPRPAFQFDFSISCDTSDDGLRAICRYNSDLLDATTARRWMGYFRTILESALADPERPIAQLPLMPESERETIAARNNTDRDFPSEATLHELFEAQATRTPEAIAATFGEKQITFAQLNTRANQLAHRLHSLGVARDVPVGICLERSLELPIALLAVLKAGGAYLPLDPSYPADRIAFMAADARTPVIISDTRWLSLLGDSAKVLCLDQEKLDAESSADPAFEVRPDDLAYIIHTSGSTGQPKGAMIPHRAICNHMLWMQEEFPLEAADRVLQKTPISFDASVWEFWAPLLAGAHLVLAAPEAHRDSRQLVDTVISQRITILQLVPSMLRIVAAEPRFPECVTLRRLFSGGEALPADLCDEVLANSKCELINLYGPTECAIDTAFHRCRKGETRVPIGRPVANTQLHIFDQQNQPLPTGIPGELHIAGAQLARGYLGNPELTAEKFITLDGGRLYKTGDLARWLPDGEVQYLGRNDGQVKLRGHRIELGEIEARLRAQPSVRDCAVAVHDGRLTAYIVGATDGTGKIALWPSSPSSGGDPFYDDVLYTAMSHDQSRLDAYRRAFEKLVPGKVVVDIGTGRDALLARMCIEAGARKVYGIELLERPAQQARALVQSLGLADRITIIQGRSQDVTLPELADVCVSENIGHIGDTEGWSGIIADAATRLIIQGGAFIPARCITKFAAVSLPREFLDDPRFDELAAHYARQTWDGAGYPHDFRLALTNTSRALLRSTEGVFERLDSASPQGAALEQFSELTVTQDGPADGFLLWLQVETVAGDKLEAIDHQDAWLPVYLPAFYPGVELRKGDRIEAGIRGAFAENKINRDYTISGRILRGAAEVTRFHFDSYHYKQVYKATPFYQALFRTDAIPSANGTEARETLATALAKGLPDYMVPTAFITLPALPRTPSGKLDRGALPAPDQRDEKSSAITSPRTPLEEHVAGIWREVLDMRHIGIDENFFEIGGESLQGLRVLNRLRDLLGENIPLSAIFEAPTIGTLATLLEKNYPAAIRNGHDETPQRQRPTAYKQIPRITRRPAQPGSPKK